MHVGARVDGKTLISLWLALLLTVPLAGSLGASTDEMSSHTSGPEYQLVGEGDITHVPTQVAMPAFDALPWWEVTTLDLNRNRIHDSLENASGPVNVGLSYGRQPTTSDVRAVEGLGHSVNLEVPEVDALLLGTVDANDVWALADLNGVVMVERYGTVVFYGDIQTPAVKARNSSWYPVGAWDLGVSGKGVNIALTDTGVDNEHPGLVGKFVAGYDAVCYMHTDPTCALFGPGRETDGTFDPDDGNQHGTACMGMASASGLLADGTQTNFTGSAPSARLIDVRIGTDVGAGPFENYLLEQQFYESAMNGVQWIINNADTAWSNEEEQWHGIDIISLSWGITSHEAGGSDGSDMHSRILDDAVEAGVTPSVAAGNDGPDNDGLSGMGSSSLSVTVGATDDQNTIDRGDDTIAGYSSRGPRRDNGDGNPYDELKPEISAPGSNIVQAEGCVSSGGCNNNIPGQNAANNGYSGRGSGTSYATPAVSGVIALVIEANPDLDPLQIKEVLKQTAERRGSATFPDIDPYWNKDFGYGMVDALGAVELAQYLNSSNQSAGIDPWLQNHLLDVNVSGSTATITGHAWAQQGTIERVEFRHGHGDWSEATYDAPLEELTPGQPFNWTVVLDVDKLEHENHSFEVRAVSGESTSLPVFAVVHGTGLALGEEGGSMATWMLLSLVVVLALASVAWRLHRTDMLPLPFGLGQRQDGEAEEPLEAELVSDETVADSESDSGG